MLHQPNLPFGDTHPLSSEALESDRIERHLGFLSSSIAAILDALPIPRRALSDSTKALHVRVTLERRNGFCPCCQQVTVCTIDGRLAGAQFDHFYGRNRNAPDETWLVCERCNRELEMPPFKASARNAFYAYQAAVLIFMAEAQQELKLFDSRG
jgi:hypothetical protein